MKCPRDRKTRMTKGADYLDMCPHCGIERFATRRAINDIVANKDNLWDFSKGKDHFLSQFSEGFRGIGELAWNRKSHNK